MKPDFDELQKEHEMKTIAVFIWGMAVVILTIVYLVSIVWDNLYSFLRGIIN